MTARTASRGAASGSRTSRRVAFADLVAAVEGARPGGAGERLGIGVLKRRAARGVHLARHQDRRGRRPRGRASPPSRRAARRAGHGRRRGRRPRRWGPATCDRARRAGSRRRGSRWRGRPPAARLASLDRRPWAALGAGVLGVDGLDALADLDQLPVARVAAGADDPAVLVVLRRSRSHHWTPFADAPFVHHGLGRERPRPGHRAELARSRASRARRPVRAHGGDGPKVASIDAKVGAPPLGGGGVPLLFCIGRA